MTSSSVPARCHRAVAYLRKRARSGFSRVRSGFGQSLQISLAAVAAYAFAEHVLGHHGPLFAATAAIVSLGYGNGSVHLRRILEVSVGCTLGIAVGDVLIHLLGQGMGQAFVVLMVSILLARFLDNGTIFTTQMGLQSVLVVLLPPSVDGPFARSLDAVVGGICALLIMTVYPRDPRRGPRKEFRKLTQEFSSVLRETGSAIGDYDSAAAWNALSRARRTQPLLTSLEASLKMGAEQARFTVLRRSRRAELEQYRNSLDGLDNAIRNTRVLARRVANVTDTVRLRPGAVASLHEALTELADAVDLIGLSFAADAEDARTAYRDKARHDLARTARTLDPGAMGVRTYQGETLVMLIRPLTVDLLVATGMSQAEASRLPVHIDQDLTEAMPVVRPEEAGRTGRRKGAEKRRKSERRRETARRVLPDGPGSPEDRDRAGSPG